MTSKICLDRRSVIGIDATSFPSLEGHSDRWKRTLGPMKHKYQGSHLLRDLRAEKWKDRFKICWTIWPSD
jgi:hypothetical protein